MNRQDSQPIQQTQNPSGTEETKFLSFFEAIHRVFHKADLSAGDSLDSFLLIGGHTIRLRFAGPALFPFVIPALEHLMTQPDPSPALTICLWDNVSTASTLPSLSWPFNDYVVRGGIHFYSGTRLSAALYGGIKILNMLDAERNLALYCIHDATRFPSYQVSSPLLTVLHWGMRTLGLQLIHAAAVGTPELGGVLIVGQGGSGKSTTALSCLDSELSYVGDDYCLLGTSPIPSAHNVYNTAKLNANHIQKLPHLVPATRITDELYNGKRLIFVNRHYPEKIANGFPLRAILVPRITGLSQTKLKPASSAAGLRALAPSTIHQLLGPSEAMFQTIASLVKQLPCYHLELGTDLDSIPEVIVNLLSH